MNRSELNAPLGIGAVASVALFLFAARHYHPGLVLVVLFVGWILSPFALVFVSRLWFGMAGGRSKLPLLIAIGDVLVYAIAAFAPPTARIVPVFVMVPPISCAVIAIGLAAAFVSSRSTKLVPPK